MSHYTILLRETMSSSSLKSVCLFPCFVVFAVPNYHHKFSQVNLVMAIIASNEMKTLTPTIEIQRGVSSIYICKHLFDGEGLDGLCQEHFHAMGLNSPPTFSLSR